MVYIENVQEKIKMSVLGHDDQKYPIQIESRWVCIEHHIHEALILCVISRWINHPLPRDDPDFLL